MLDEQRKDILSQISNIESRIAKNLEQKTQLESTIPDSSVGGGFMSILCLVGVVALIIFVFSSAYTDGEKLLAAIGLIAMTGIGEWVGNSLSEARESRIRKEHAGTIAQINEAEKQDGAYRKILEDLSEKYDGIIRQQRNWWTALDGWSFEKEVAKVFQANGYIANVTKGSNDGGIDINLYRNDRRIIVQCKNHKAAIGPSPVRDLLGTLASTKADGAIMVSRTGYTSGAQRYAHDNNIKLMTVEDIIDMHKQA